MRSIIVLFVALIATCAIMNNVSADCVEMHEPITVVLGHQMGEIETGFILDPCDEHANAQWILDAEVNGGFWHEDGDYFWNIYDSENGVNTTDVVEATYQENNTDITLWAYGGFHSSLCDCGNGWHTGGKRWDYTFEYQGNGQWVAKER